MKYMKMFGLLAIAAAALMAFAGPASATLTEDTGDPVEANDIVHASSEGATELHGTVTVKCEVSTVGGTVTAAGGTTGVLHTLTFEKCGPDTVKVIKKGHLTVHSNRDVTSTGAEVTIQVHRTIIGFPVTTHCTYVTNNTKVGELTESDRDPAGPHTMATMDIKGAQIPIDELTSDPGCGDTAEWTGNYTVEEPAFLAVD